MAFTPTQDQIERHERWLDKYEKTILEAWKNQGADLNDPDIPKALSAIRKEMRVPERPQWMEPKRAFAVIAAWLPNDSPKDLLDMQDALRTRASMTVYEWREVGAEVMGIGIDQVKRYEPEHYGDDETTYLYRIFDSDNNLLYIGMTNDPAYRFQQHQDRSIWWTYADRHTIEEFPTRQQAFRRETKAIQAERPIFNKVASRRDHTDAVRYIMSRTSFEPDTLF